MPDEPRNDCVQHNMDLAKVVQWHGLSRPRRPQEAHQGFRGQLLDRELPGGNGNHIRLVLARDDRIGGQAVRPAGATILEHQFTKPSRYVSIGIVGSVMRWSGTMMSETCVWWMLSIRIIGAPAADSRKATHSRL